MIRQVEALFAEHRVLLDPRQGFREFLDERRGSAEQKESQARRRFLTDPRKFLQVGDQALDRG